MEDEEAVVVATCAAVAHAAVSLATTCEPPPREPKKQIRTVAVLHFEPMFQSAAYAAWFEDNLRCTKSTHDIRLATAKITNHSYNKKVAAALYFYFWALQVSIVRLLILEDALSLYDLSHNT
ncbi:hypothetical protein JG687_00016772 [Phytophthora cactorum]|uniref:Uncharacterized protein n=1 Tax=Phytophthora cactorum TaxID=29920 RepID=A0A8T1TRG4_9STRA|nr:hypothetical protein JG687_00016772 [Phytophthora cactorum]